MLPLIMRSSALPCSRALAARPLHASTFVRQLHSASFCSSSSGASSRSLDVTEQEVLGAQAAWASSIKAISAAYLTKGDYVKAAADAAA